MSIFSRAFALKVSVSVSIIVGFSLHEANAMGIRLPDFAKGSFSARKSSAPVTTAVPAPAPAPNPGPVPVPVPSTFKALWDGKHSDA
ncbi:MAG: hypothetical protein V4692_11500, partial [Bdellovibrionota bacterium]